MNYTLIKYWHIKSFSRQLKCMNRPPTPNKQTNTRINTQINKCSMFTYEVIQSSGQLNRHFESLILWPATSINICLDMMPFGISRQSESTLICHPNPVTRTHTPTNKNMYTNGDKCVEFLFVVTVLASTHKSWYKKFHKSMCLKWFHTNKNIPSSFWSEPFF